MPSLRQIVKGGLSVRHGNPDRVDDYLNLMAQRLDEPNLEKLSWLGSGTYAQVFWMSDKKKVLKFTYDLSDAYACSIVQKRPDPAFVKIYDVFALTSVDASFYGIMAEKLTPLTTNNEIRIEKMNDLFIEDLGIFGHITTKALKEFKKQMHLPYIQDTIEEAGIEDIYADVELLQTWAKALEARGIRWGDLKPENIMNRGQALVISDLGYSNVHKQRIPILGA